MLKRFSETFKILFEDIKTVEGIKVTGVLNTPESENIFFDYKNTKASIEYVDFGFIELKTEGENKELKEKLDEFISDFFDWGPCIEYKIKKEEYIEDALTWDLNDEDAFVLNIMLDNALNGGYHDINVLTSKPLEYYNKRLTRLPGTYPGNLTEAEIEFALNCSEYNLYYMILNKIQELRGINDTDEINFSELDPKTEESRFALEYLCVLTSRFGTKVSYSQNHNAIELPMEYALWLSSWNTYICDVLSDENVALLNTLASNMIDVYPILTTYDSDMYSDGLKHIFIDTNAFRN